MKYNNKTSKRLKIKNNQNGSGINLENKENICIKINKFDINLFENNTNVFYEDIDSKRINIPARDEITQRFYYKTIMVI